MAAGMCWRRSSTRPMAGLRYAWNSMPTAKGFTGQRVAPQQVTGLPGRHALRLALGEAFEVGELGFGVLLVLPLDHQLVEGRAKERARHCVGQRERDLRHVALRGDRPLPARVNAALGLEDDAFAALVGDRRAGPVERDAGHAVLPFRVEVAQRGWGVRENLQVGVQFGLPLRIFEDGEHRVYRRVNCDAVLDQGHMSHLSVARPVHHVAQTAHSANRDGIVR